MYVSVCVCVDTSSLEPSNVSVAVTICYMCESVCKSWRPVVCRLWLIDGIMSKR